MCCFFIKKKKNKHTTLLFLPPLGALKDKYNPCLVLRKKGNSPISRRNARLGMDPTLKASGKRRLKAFLMTTR